MIVLQTCLVVLLSVVSCVVGQYRCNDFTISDCDLASHVIWESDVIPDKETCQTTCHNYADCKLFFFLDGTCTLFDGDYRDECAVVGGSPLQSVDECVNGVDHGCDAFLGEQCVYEGQDFGLSPPNGQLNTALECEEFCVLYKDIGCQYWVFNKTEMSCKILDSFSRDCRGFTGPAYPDYSECQGSGPGQCKEGETYFGHTNMCYKFYSDRLLWADANQACIDAGGNLASILDPETNEFITTLTKEYTWIGGHRLEDDQDVWGWADGSEWSYENWNGGEPNNAGGREDCVAINWGQPGRWDDGYIDASYPYLCQFFP